MVAGETVKAAVGLMAVPPTVTAFEDVPVRPAESVAVSVTVKLPALSKRCDSVTPVPKWPSPKSHE
jgi:hypothetical protein